MIFIASAIASAIGVATYTDTRVADFSVTWETRAVVLEEMTESQTGPGEVTLLVPINLTNLHTLEFTMGVGSPAVRVQPMDVRVELTPPAGAGDSTVQEFRLSSGSGVQALLMTYDLAPVPNATRVTASSVEDATVKANATAASTRGLGSWTFVVSFASVAPGPLPAESYTVNVAPEALVYESRVAPVAPEVAR